MWKRRVRNVFGELSMLVMYRGNFRVGDLPCWEHTPSPRLKEKRHVEKSRILGTGLGESIGFEKTYDLSRLPVMRS